MSIPRYFAMPIGEALDYVQEKTGVEQDIYRVKAIYWNRNGEIEFVTIESYNCAEDTYCSIHLDEDDVFLVVDE